MTEYHEEIASLHNQPAVIAMERPLRQKQSPLRQGYRCVRPDQYRREMI